MRRYCSCRFRDTSDGASGASPTLVFTDTTEFDYWPGNWPKERRTSSAYAGDRPDGYDVFSNNPVWLPAEDVAGASGDSDDVIYLDSGLGVEPRGAGGTGTFAISLWRITERLDSVTGPGDGAEWSVEEVENYDRCIRVSLDVIRNHRDLWAYWGEPTAWEVTKIEREITAGAPQGTEVDSIDGAGVFSHWGPGWRVWPKLLWGVNDEFFLFEFGGAGDGPDGYDPDTTTTGPLSSGTYTEYGLELTTTRPLPAGTYEAHRSLSPWFTRCSSPVPIDHRLAYVVTVKPVEHTLHETLWDVGEPVRDPNFPSVHNNSEATLRGIDYKDGQVQIDISPFDAFAGQDIEFIELDGTVGLRLSAETAAVNGTVLGWSVDQAPWALGDKLLVRIKSDGFIVPTRAHATSNAPGEVTVVWNGGLNATRYIISLDGERDRFGIQEAEFEAPATSHTFTGVSAGLYSVLVIAIKEYGPGSMRDAKVVSNWGGCKRSRVNGKVWLTR